MPADRMGDPGRLREDVESRMDALVSALTGGARSPFAEPLGGDGDADTEPERVTGPPRGASQEAVDAAIRRVEADEADGRQDREEHVVV